MRCPCKSRQEAPAFSRLYGIASECSLLGRRLFWEQDQASSILVTPTIRARHFGCLLCRLHRPSKHKTMKRSPNAELNRKFAGSARCTVGLPSRHRGVRFSFSARMQDMCYGSTAGFHPVSEGSTPSSRTIWTALLRIIPCNDLEDRSTRSMPRWQSFLDYIFVRTTFGEP